MENENNETQINLIEVFKSLLKRWWIIVASSVFCVLVIFIYLYRLKPDEYQASVRMYVNNNSLSIGSSQISISSSDISANRSLVDSYAVILTSNTTLEKIFDKAGIPDEDDISLNKYKTKFDAKTGKYDYDYDYLRKMISVKAVQDTEIFSVTFTCENSADSITLANTVIQVFPEIVENIIEGSVAKPVDNAKYATKVDKGYTKYCIIAFLVGFVLSCGSIFVYDFFINDTITSSDYITQSFESIPLLSVIPDTNLTQSSKYGKHYYKNGYGYYQNYYENKEEDK